MSELYKNKIDLLMDKFPGLIYKISFDFYFKLNGITKSALIINHLTSSIGGEYLSITWATNGTLTVDLDDYTGYLYLKKSGMLLDEVLIKLHDIFDTKLNVFIDQKSFDMIPILRENTINRIINQK